MSAYLEHDSTQYHLYIPLGECIGRVYFRFFHVLKTKQSGRFCQFRSAQFGFKLSVIFRRPKWSVRFHRFFFFFFWYTPLPCKKSLQKQLQLQLIVVISKRPSIVTTNHQTNTYKDSFGLAVAFAFKQKQKL